MQYLGSHSKFTMLDVAHCVNGSLIAISPGMGSSGVMSRRSICGGILGERSFELVVRALCATFSSPVLLKMREFSMVEKGRFP